MSKLALFGTDGIRGRFGDFPLERRTVTALGRQLATLLARPSSRQSSQPSVVLGGDTRFSTPQLCDWLATGLRQGGARGHYCGIVPTPAIAWATRDLGADCGIAVSASHNPYPDNGIKLIGRDGFKWSLEQEGELERMLLTEATRENQIPPATATTDLHAEELIAARYLASVEASVEANANGSTRSSRPLAGLRCVLDPGNGAASAFAGPLFERLGAEVRLLHHQPNGRNINRDCGSTHPQEMARAVVEGGFDLGMAFDGDADRVIFADELGTIRDGDATLYLWARQLASRDRLPGHRIVATSMSNLGLERALSRQGIAVERCGVGDRVVVATMRQHGIVLGGEQSGHIVHLGLSTTGDGLATAAQIALIQARAGEAMSALLADFESFPQILLNVPVGRKPDLATLPSVRRAARQVEAALGDEGRLVLRYSGTEPLARVMIEGPEQERIESLAKELGAVIASELADG